MSQPAIPLPRPLPARSVAAFLFVAAALCMPLAGRCGNDDDYRDLSVISKWRIAAVLDIADMASLNDKDAKRLLGKVLTISANEVRLEKRECSSSEFWAERVVPELEIREKVHASARKLHLPNPVTVVELSCTDVYIRDKDHLVFLWGGAFFDTVRIKPDKPLEARATRNGFPRAAPKKARQPQPRPASKAGPGKVQRVSMPFAAP